MSPNDITKNKEYVLSRFSPEITLNYNIKNKIKKEL
jgi:hypothetical protein